MNLTTFDGFLKVAGIQDLHVHLSCHEKKKKERKKAEFLTLEKSLKMFLACTLMEQKAEGKEKKRSLKMP